MGISVCIEQQVKRVVFSGWSSLPCAIFRHIITVISDPYIGRAKFTGIWLQWPHWEVMLLTTPSKLKARGPDAAAERSQQATSPCRCCGNFTAYHWICMLSCYLMVYPSLPRRTCASNAHYTTTLDTMQWATDRLSVLTFSLQEGVYRSLLLPANRRRLWDDRGHGRRLGLTIPINPSFHLLLIREG